MVVIALVFSSSCKRCERHCVAQLGAEQLARTGFTISSRQIGVRIMQGRRSRDKLGEKTGQDRVQWCLARH